MKIAWAIFEKMEIFFLCELPLILSVDQKLKRQGGDICKGTLDIKCKQYWSSADEEHSVFVRKLQLFYIFLFHLYILTMLTCGPNDADRQSLASVALSPPFHFVC